MNSSEDKMLYQLTGKENLEKITFEELESINQQYPYFSAARLLLAKKMKKENHPAFLQQIQQTALYFPNPFWLHYQLIHEDIFTIPEQPVSGEETGPMEPASAAMNLEPTPPPAPEMVIEEPAAAGEVPMIPAETEVPEILPDTTLSAEPMAVLPTEPTGSEQEEPAAEPLEMPPGSALSRILEEQAASFHKPIGEHAKLPLETEPYYTVDYFASQGIRLDIPGTDRLGTQVRRFTDWLKQMKKINPHPADLGTSPEMEHQVQHIAASSNEPREVLTEAMAEVLVKQGKTDKAIQLFIKLSFLEPQKSAYFATRIQELKGI